MPGGDPGSLETRRARSSRRSAPRSTPMASPAATGSARVAPATTSRWSTTASNTATCSSSARPTPDLQTRRLHRPGTRQSLHRLERGRARKLPDRDHRDIFEQNDPRGTGKSWSTRSSTPPARKAPASGRSQRRSTGHRHHHRRGRRSPLPLGTQGKARRSQQSSAQRPRGPSRRQSRAFVAKVRQALYASKIISYAQGLMLMRHHRRRGKDWKLDLGAIAAMWRGGCIIRARFLNEIKAYLR